MRGHAARCGVNLASIKAKLYCHKKRVCQEHLQAESVQLPGVDGEHRFCHQCGKFEPLTRFDGVRRSCRDRLVLRRKPAGRSAAAPDSQSGSITPACCHTPQDLQLPGAADSAALAAAASCSQLELYEAAGCSMLDDTAVTDVTDLELKQLLEAELATRAAAAAASSAAAVAASSAAAVAAVQQPSFMGLLTEDSNEAAPQCGNENFEEFLATMMQQELEDCMQQHQHHHQASLQQHVSSSCGARPTVVVQDASACTAHAGPAVLSPGYISNALQHPADTSSWTLNGNGHAAAETTACTEAGAAAAACMSPTSDDSDNSSTLPVLDVHAGLVAPAMPQCASAAAAAADANNINQQLLRQMQDLLQENRMLREATAAAAASTPAGAVLGSSLPSAAVGAMPAQLPAASVHTAVTKVPSRHQLSLSHSQSGAFRATSGMATLLAPPASSHAAMVLHNNQLIQQQLQQQRAAAAAAALAQEQEQEAAFAERLACLQSQFHMVSSELAQLRNMMGGSRAARSQSIATGPMAFCPGMPSYSTAAPQY